MSTPSWPSPDICDSQFLRTRAFLLSTLYATGHALTVVALGLGIASAGPAAPHAERSRRRLQRLRRHGPTVRRGAPRWGGEAREGRHSGQYGRVALSPDEPPRDRENRADQEVRRPHVAGQVDVH